MFTDIRVLPQAMFTNIRVKPRAIFTDIQLLPQALYDHFSFEPNKYVKTSYDKMPNKCWVLKHLSSNILFEGL